LTRRQPVFVRYGVGATDGENDTVVCTSGGLSQ
jgi:hypothetical protein